MSIIYHDFDGFSISQTVETTKIGNAIVPAGYVNLTELCRAGGKKLSGYLRLSGTQEFISVFNETLKQEVLIDASPSIIIIQGSFAGVSTLQGSWGHFDVAMDVARWISTPFRIKANRVLSQVITGNFKALTPEAELAMKKLIELWNLIRQHGKETRNNLTDSIKDYLLRHPEKSDDYKRWIYANATNAMYNAVFGMNAIELEEFLTCSRNKSRDHLDTKCLDKIDRVEAAICDLINDQDIEPTQAVSEYIRFMKVKPMFPNKKLEPCDFN